MRIIVFDITGYIAHFRKHFTTTSSLSYTFPPRTTICGMVAGILGYDRDSYYEKFSSEECKIGLQIIKPIRRLVQTINYLMTDEEAIGYFKKTFRWGDKPAQIRMELIMADSQLLSEVHYRIFFHHENLDLMLLLEDKLHMKRFYYPPSLGTANNLATINYVDTDTVAEFFRPDREIPISTVIPVSMVKSIIPERGLKIYREELVPADFLKDRILKREESYIYECEGKPIKVLLNGEAFICKVKGREVAGTFM